MARGATGESASSITKFIARGANVNCIDNFGPSPLIIADENWRLGCARAALAAEIDLFQRAIHGNTALHLACGLNADVDLVELLLEAGMHVEITGSHGWKPIHLAAVYSKQEIVETFVQFYGANMDSRATNGKTGLHLCA